MQNPRKLKVGYVKNMGNPFAMKAYRGVVGRPTSGVFRRATDAQGYAVRVFQRWCRLYDAAILAQMSSPSPVAAEEGQVVTE